MIAAFIYGLVLAFGLIIPLGVQNVFIFNQGARHRHFLYALPSIITAGICDTLLILIAVLGVSVAVLHMQWLKLIIFIIGFFFLLYMGWVTWHSKAPKDGEDHRLSARKQIIFATSVSILNPHALIDSIAVIGVNALQFEGKARIAYTLACILVSFSWFFSLAVAGHTLHKFDSKGIWFRVVNKLSAIIIWTVAGYIFWQIMTETTTVLNLHYFL